MAPPEAARRVVEEELLWLRRSYGASLMRDRLALRAHLLEAVGAQGDAMESDVDAVVSAVVAAAHEGAAESYEAGVAPVGGRGEWARQVAQHAVNWRGDEPVAAGRPSRASLVVAALSPALVIVGVTVALTFFPVGEEEVTAPAQPSPTVRPTDPAESDVTDRSVVPGPAEAVLRLGRTREEGLDVRREWRLDDDELVVAMDVSPADGVAAGAGGVFTELLPPGAVVAAEETLGRKLELADFRFDAPGLNGPRATRLIGGRALAYPTRTLDDMGRATIGYVLPIESGEFEPAGETLEDWYQSWLEVRPDSLPTPLPLDGA